MSINVIWVNQECVHERNALKICTWKALHLPPSFILLNLLLFIQVTKLFFPLFLLNHSEVFKCESKGDSH